MKSPQKGGSEPGTVRRHETARRERRFRTSGVDFSPPSPASAIPARIATPRQRVRIGGDQRRRQWPDRRGNAQSGLGTNSQALLPSPPLRCTGTVPRARFAGQIGHQREWGAGLLTTQHPSRNGRPGSPCSWGVSPEHRFPRVWSRTAGSRNSEDIFRESHRLNSPVAESAAGWTTIREGSSP